MTFKRNTRPSISVDERARLDHADWCKVLAHAASAGTTIPADEALALIRAIARAHVRQRPAR